MTTPPATVKRQIAPPHPAFGGAVPAGAEPPPGAPASPAWRARLARWGMPTLVVLLAGLALWTLRSELAAYRYRDLMRLARELPTPVVLLALGLTVLGYVAMLGYDLLALRYVGRQLPLRRTALASFIAYTFSQNLGFSALTGASVRYRFWSAWGLSADEIARGVLFTTITFWLGIFSVAGASLLLSSALSAPVAGLPAALIPVLGTLFLAITAGYVVWCARGTRTLRLRGWTLPAPSAAMAGAQVLVSAVDWVLAGLVLYVLLPHHNGLTIWTFLAAFLVAQTSGLLSHVPGGLGVFETVIVLLLEPYVPPATTIASLIAYRGVYYLFPLALATLALAGHELAHRKERLSRLARAAGAWAPGIVPHLLSVTTFTAGAILLVSGATPAVGSRLRWLHRVFPLAVIEISHFVNSLLGVGLLVLALGLRRRLDAAYHLTVFALGAGIATSLLKGGDYEEALALALVLGALLTSRRHFTRPTALVASPFTPAWIAAVAFVLVGTVWLGFFSYQHVEYTGELWWRFTLRGDAPRFLRGMVGAAGVMVLFAFAHLMRVAPVVTRRPTREELDRAQELLGSEPDSNANIALLGDKSLLFGERGRGFLMYGVEGRSWIALGDPLGPSEVRTELAWKFREMADRAGGWTVFYQASRHDLPLYIDLGLTMLKIGEMARVPLETFSLDGGARKGMRRTVKDVEKDGCTFAIVGRDEVPALLPELRRVSGAWLAAKRTREKAFSLGYFDDAYIARFPQALVRRGDEIVAFANIWEGAGKEELSVDLMRYSPAAPSGVMEYLFIQLMLHGRREGYRWFNLGMAPLSGLENRTLAPLWNRVGSLVYRHGEHFYNFRGLRQYKEKFDPVWEPRYIASPGGIALPRILANIAALISGGLRGVVVK